MKILLTVSLLTAFHLTAQMTSLRDFKAVIGYNQGFTVSDITQTADSGYAFNCSAGMFFADGGMDYKNVLIKTDSNFIPQWSYQISGRNGKNSFACTNGDLISYTSYNSVIDLFCFKSDGLLRWSNRNLLPVSTGRGFDIADAAFSGSLMRFAGFTYHYNDYQSRGTIVRIDTNGTIVGTDSLGIPGYANHEINRIVKGASNDFYISGELTNSSTDYANFVSHVDASNNVLWTAKIAWPSYYSYMQQSLCVQSNGDVYFGAIYPNTVVSPAGSATAHITRLSPGGTQIWTKTLDEIGSLSNLKALDNGHILLSGSFRDPGTYSHRVTLIELDENGNVVWAKKYYRNYGNVGIPFFSSSDSLHVVFRHTGQLLKMLNVDASGNSQCLAIDYAPVFHDVSVAVAPMNIQVLSGTAAAIDAFHPQPYAQTQLWTDTCLSYPSSSATINVCPGSDYLFADSTTAVDIQSGMTHTSLLSEQAAGGGDSLVVETLQVVVIDSDVTVSTTSLMAEQADASYQWIDCSTGEPVSGATNQEFFPSTGGSYAVAITTDGCADTSECAVIQFASTMDLTSTRVSVYPNPTNGSAIYVSLSTAGAIAFTLTDLNGRIVLQLNTESAQKHQLALPDLASGLYEYTIRTGKAETLRGKIAVTNDQP